MTAAPAFTADEHEFLRRLVGLMIPALPADNLPGADDDAIFASLLAKASTRTGQLQVDLHALAAGKGGLDGLLALDASAFAGWFEAEASRWQSHALFRRLAPLLARAYYEDFRVQQAHGRRPGPPYPEGYTVPQGDWSLIDPVRSRPPIYRG